MSNYFILQTNDESAAYAFRVTLDGYSPYTVRTQKEQYTVTGDLDVQTGPAQRVFVYGVKITSEVSGSFSVSAGSIMTATSISWGTWANLKSLFNTATPPDNKLRMRDLDDSEYWVYFSGRMDEKLLAPGGSLKIVNITLKES
jgi:hypothetical protein